MAPTDPAATRSWRPQAFGTRGHRHVDNPLVEPLWAGVRVLVHADGGRITIDDDAGADLTADQAGVASALAPAIDAASAVVDGYLTRWAARETAGIFAGPDGEAPTAGGLTRQLFLGSGGRDRGADLEERAAARKDARLDGEGSVAFVAVDLLLVDGESLLDVPLLERKRLLDGVMVESELVRLGTFVRPPIETWFAQWRAFGFREMAFKAANSRYVPGAPNDAWAVTRIPRRR
jgi:ATP-dependent DNA ligase